MKKKLIYLFLIVTSGFFQSIFAESVTPIAPFSFNAFGPYLYIGAQGGWARSDWSGFTGLSSNDTGGVFGGKIGYQTTRRFGVEGGGFLLPNSHQEINSTRVGTVKSWVGYGAATFRFPLSSDERLFLRGKVGGAYRNLEHDGVLYAGVGDGSYVTAILGASLNYAFATTLPVIVGVEYSNIFSSDFLGSDKWSSNGKINPDAAPAAQIVTATLSVAL